MISPSEVSAYLNVHEQRNEKIWNSNYFADRHYWKVTYSGSVPACEIYVELNGTNLCLQIELKVRVNPDCQAALHMFLLRLNEDLPVVKFGLQERGSIVLMAEALAAQMNFNVFDDLLQALIAVSVHYRREIELLAGEPELAGIVNRPAIKPIGVTVLKSEPAAQPTRP